MEYFASRRDRLRKLLSKASVDTLLVTNYPNVTYLTGFTGDDSYLLITRSGEVLISDARYTTQLEEECPRLNLHIRQPGQAMLDGTMKVLKQAKVSRLGVEGDSMTVGYHQRLAEKAEKVEFVTTSGLVEQLRMIKDKEEIAEIRQAVAIAEKAFAVVRAALRPEQTEKEIADALDSQMRLFGGRGASFTPIVGVGDRAALPHYRPGLRKVGDADFILIDWGALGRLYMSDLTRTLVTGKIPPKLQRIYEVVLQAQLTAIDAIRPGRTCGEIDAAARNVIEKAGYGKQFGHGLGHSLGLQIHEDPRFSRKQTMKLEPGMVMTVEPGIYLPGFGGVRIEDDVLVTRGGCEVLTSVPKQWHETIVAVN
ncbi:MAG TPA: Xaa-Pro peptidase family protein [Pirellulales bacterium]|jgi:Xaa-Pro aminopeptidase|nr:Xaa-Pro peptidase family protein [Pirellulales bacterium]